MLPAAIQCAQDTLALVNNWRHVRVRCREFGSRCSRRSWTFSCHCRCLDKRFWMLHACKVELVAKYILLLVAASGNLIAVTVAVVVAFNKPKSVHSFAASWPLLRQLHHVPAFEILWRTAWSFRKTHICTQIAIADPSARRQLWN